MAATPLPLPPPQVPLFTAAGLPTQQGFEFLDRLQSLVKQINASLSSLNYAPTAAQYVTMALDGTLSAERTLAVSAALLLTDGGANNPATIGRAALTGDATAAADSNALTLVKASSLFSFTGIITPPQITANQNDYSPTGIGTANVLRLSSDATRDITGINANTNTSGRILILLNVGANNIDLRHENASSSAANRFNNLTGADPSIIGQFGQRTIWYDATLSRWLTI